MPNAGSGISKYTYISSSILACSCGGQLVQLPGSEKVKPASRRPAATLSAISTFNSRFDPGFPATNFMLGFLETSVSRATFKGDGPLTSAALYAKSPAG